MDEICCDFIICITLKQNDMCNVNNAARWTQYITSQLCLLFKTIHCRCKKAAIHVVIHLSIHIGIISQLIVCIPHISLMVTGIKELFAHLLCSQHQLLLFIVEVTLLIFFLGSVLQTGMKRPLLVPAKVIDRRERDWYITQADCFYIAYQVYNNLQVT